MTKNPDPVEETPDVPTYISTNKPVGRFGRLLCRLKFHHWVYAELGFVCDRCRTCTF